MVCYPPFYTNLIRAYVRSHTLCSGAPSCGALSCRAPSNDAPLKPCTLIHLPIHPVHVTKQNQRSLLLRHAAPSFATTYLHTATSPCLPVSPCGLATKPHASTYVRMYCFLCMSLTTHTLYTHPLFPEVAHVLTSSSPLTAFPCLFLSTMACPPPPLGLSSLL